jgi:molecular chaperone DnaK
VDIHVLQGERPLARDNNTLGRFRLDGIPPAPRGIPQIEVTFDIDANGILNVHAKDKATGREQKIVITASTNLNKGDVERMVQEAQRHAAEDNRRKESIQARNEADTLIYQIEKSMREAQVPAAERSRVEDKIKALKDVLNSDDAPRIRRAMDELQQAAMAMGQAIYGQPGAGSPPPTAGGQPFGGNGNGNGQQYRPESDGVVEGEFRSV